MNLKKISVILFGSIAVSSAYASAYTFNLTPSNPLQANAVIQTQSCPSANDSETGVQYEAAAENYRNARKALDDQKSAAKIGILAPPLRGSAFLTAS